MVTIYHNPRCAKSRHALSLLEKKEKVINIIEYLKTPPNENELANLLKMLGMNAEEIVRKGESLYKEKYKGKNLTDKQWIKILANNPILIERPIIVKGKKAVLGRPPQNVSSLF